MADQVQLFRRLFDEGFTGGNIAVVDELVSEDFQEHQAGQRPGREGLKALIQQLHSWFSDFTLTIQDLTEDGDKVWARLKGGGTHTGMVMGQPPSGRHVEIDVIDIIRFSDGKMVEHWGVPDTLNMMRQIGLIPAPGR